jgi:sec-independent protein translocase protein TatC
MSAQPVGPQTFVDHIYELRNRLAWILVSLLAGFGVSYMFRVRIFDLLLKPLDQPLFYTSPTGGFDFLLKTCIFSGFILCIPVVIYHLIRFLEPTLSRPLRLRIVSLLLFSWLLAGLGIGFAYQVSLPAALHFLGEFSTDQVRSLIAADQYFSFILVYLGGFAAIFQLPMLLLFLNSMHRLEFHTLLKQVKLVILISFVLSAIITPTPDPVNQTIMALPLIILYYFSCFLIAYVNRPKKSVRKKRSNVPPPSLPQPPSRRHLSDLRVASSR